jgi:outer membrane murein-binding lipoprotein Lpp
MTRRKTILIILSLVTTLSLSACSSSVKRNNSNSSINSSLRSEVNEVTINFTDEVKTKIKNINSFNIIKFNEGIIEKLDSSGLLNASSQKTLEIEIDSIRIRSAFSAVMFGFMAGADHISGNIIIKNKSQHVIGEYEISASYALGGLAGGQNETRINWMSNRFSELTAETLSGGLKLSELDQ